MVSGQQYIDSWFVILCLNLARIREAQIDDRALFMDMSLRVFLQGNKILISRVCKVAALTIVKGRYYPINSNTSSTKIV